MWTRFSPLEKIDSGGFSLRTFFETIGGLGEAKSTMYLVFGRRSDVRDRANVLDKEGRK